MRTYEWMFPVSCASGSRRTKSSIYGSGLARLVPAIHARQDAVDTGETGFPRGDRLATLAPAERAAATRRTTTGPRHRGSSRTRRVAGSTQSNSATMHRSAESRDPKSVIMHLAAASRVPGTTAGNDPRRAWSKRCDMSRMRGRPQSNEATSLFLVGETPATAENELVGRGTSFPKPRQRGYRRGMVRSKARQIATTRGMR